MLLLIKIKINPLIKIILKIKVLHKVKPISIKQIPYLNKFY